MTTAESIIMDDDELLLTMGVSPARIVNIAAGSTEDDIDRIERDRKRREKELLLLLLLLVDDILLYAERAEASGRAALPVIRDMWLGGTTGAVATLARAMADAHAAGVKRAARLAGTPVQPSSATDLTRQYEPAARQAAESAVDGLAAKLAQAEVGVREGMKQAGWLSRNPTALKRLSTRAVLTAYNGGMFAGMFGGAKVTGFRHISVVDAVTTEICLQRSGLTLPIDDPYWISNWCPLHWNCRSVILPISIDGPWSVVYPSEPPAAGFGRLPDWILNRMAVAA